MRFAVTDWVKSATAGQAQLRRAWDVEGVGCESGCVRLELVGCALRGL